MSSRSDWVARHALVWFDGHGRRGLPWHCDRTPYRVWISEVMLQQTQVKTVVPYFQKFVAQLPSLEALALAKEDEVLGLWTGLGYYRRARHLHRTARIVREVYGGRLPATLDELVALPGIGRSTGGAILAQAYGLRGVILDANVRRVLSRFHAKALENSPGNAETWRLATAHTPLDRPGDYAQAMMDLGSQVCRSKSPNCGECPLRLRCETVRLGLDPGQPQSTPTVRSAVKTRRVKVFLVHSLDGETLLEKRADTGTWAGLWTPPERDVRTTWGTLAKNLGLDDKPACVQGKNDEVVHRLSHVRYAVAPVQVYLQARASEVRLPNHLRWHQRGEAVRYGLSSLALKLLDLYGPKAPE